MPVVEVSHLRKAYRGHDAVRDISLTIEPGEIFGLLGPNGAGKTTTVECLAGLREPDGGTIKVLGLDPRRDRAELRQRVGIQLQAAALPDKLKVWEALALYSSFYRQPADWELLLDGLGLAEKRDARFEQLSGGQKQRLSIALALCGSPELAILDELSTGLDPQARRDVWELIRQIRGRGVTVVLVTHAMQEAEELCDRLAVIDRGRVAALGTPAGLIASSGAVQHVRFRPSAALDEGLLAGLPEVSGIERQGAQWIITGTGNLLGAVTAALARQQIVAEELRVGQATLDDAFAALTGRGELIA